MSNGQPERASTDSGAGDVGYASSPTLLRVEALSVSVARRRVRRRSSTTEEAVGRRILNDISLHLSGAEILGVVGESGSGKSTLALALLGFCASGLEINAGKVELAGTDVIALPESERRRLRGSVISYVPQDPPAALNPAHSVEKTLRRMIRAHGGVEEESRGEPAQTQERICSALRLVDLPTDDMFLRKYPHQLSGGQQQRLAIATAVVCRPQVVVFDEPTTGLDPITQEYVLTSIAHLRAATDMAIVVISHDLSAVKRIADRVAVMNEGRIVESATTMQMWKHPREEYTQSLLAAMPHFSATAEAGFTGAGYNPDDDDGPGVGGMPVLEIQGLSIAHRTPHGKPHAVLEDANLTVGRGERVAIVGASGSGKTSLARAVVGLLEPSAGTVKLDDTRLAGLVTSRDRADLQRVQIVFQNPYSALNPRRRVGDAIADPLRRLRGIDRKAARSRSLELLEEVGLPRSFAHRLPAQLSGGERQRVAIAQAISVNPDVLICDEITSALDVQSQAKVLDLLRGLSEHRQMALVFISHDLAVVDQFAQRIVVVADGSIVEEGTPFDILRHPKHAYTKQYVSAALSEDLAPELPKDS